jgi:hypothetical protein
MSAMSVLCLCSACVAGWVHRWRWQEYQVHVPNPKCVSRVCAGVGVEWTMVRAVAAVLATPASYASVARFHGISQWWRAPTNS